MSLRKSFMRRISTRTQPIVSDSKSCTDSAGVGDVAVEKLTVDEEDSWGTLCADLLGEIIGRVEAAGDRWPLRRSVVACGGVCKRWRDITKEIVRCSEKITFPSCLKLAGPHEPSQQCIIVRDKKNSTFYLYMAIPNTFTVYGKLLLAAKRCRHGAHTEYIISLDCNDISQRSNTYVGKLSSDFLGTNFTIFDSQAPHNDVRPSNHKGSRRVASKQISPQIPAGNFEVAQVSYKFNLLKSGGPRRMVCNVKTPCSDTKFNQKHEEVSKEKKSESSISRSTVLRNKAPTWHEHLQCWCLNFHGRVTVASVKNFQLFATIDQNQPGVKLQEETILLQFGKVADDTFTMDYRHPLSAFQAFAICLTSFGTKLACE